MFIALDQALWCWLTLGRYHPDVTLSAQAWIWEMRGTRRWPRLLIDALFSPLEIEHCRNSWLAEFSDDYLRAR